jgi:hypothetical protein
MFVGSWRESKVCGLLDRNKNLWYFQKEILTKIGYIRRPQEVQIQREKSFYTKLAGSIPNFVSLASEVAIGLYDDTSLAYVVDTEHKLWLMSTTQATHIETPFDVYKVACLGIRSYVIDTHGHIWRRIHSYFPQVEAEINFTLIENLPPVRNWVITESDIFLVCGSELWSFRNRAVIEGLPEPAVDISGDEKFCVLLTQSGKVWHLKFSQENPEQTIALPTSSFIDEDYMGRTSKPYLWCECTEILGFPKITNIDVALGECYAIDEKGLLWVWEQFGKFQITILELL